MNNFFYMRLALTNLKKNRSTYVPYMVACIGTVFTYFLLGALSNNSGMKNIPTSESLKMLFDIGCRVTAIFSVIFILYANSFLMKRRKKEIGLYSILGLEKRHISYVMFFEMLIMSVISIGSGIILGTVFGKLCFLLLLFFIQVSPESSFLISGRVIGNSVLFFFALFIVTFIINYIQVKTNNPITLLKGEKAGEKEPRSSILFTLVGIAGIGCGYYLAQSSNSVMASPVLFLIAVISVIIGTYGMFIAGSIVILKWLRKRKRIYYTPDNFIAISNMIYRMKKNAAGLANICILSTMVLVVISTTVSLYLGKADMLRSSCPYDLMVETNETVEDKAAVRELVEDITKKHHVDITELVEYTVTEMTMQLDKSTFTTIGSTNTMMMDTAALYGISFLTLEDYNRLAGSQETLEDGEVLVYNMAGDYREPEIDLFGQSLKIKKELKTFEELGPKKGKSFASELYVIAKDKPLIEDLYKDYMTGTKSDVISDRDMFRYYINVNLRGLHDTKIAAADEIRETIKSEYEISRRDYQVDSYDSRSDDWNSLYGGLLFLGVILGVLFIIAMVLIIYFKQVSEGYEDRVRFEVLQKVGMDQDEIKGAINRQIRMVFLLPVIGAVIHIGFAFRIICMLLAMFGFSNDKMFFWCVCAVVLAFCVLYFVVYSLTARVYNHIIHSR